MNQTKISWTDATWNCVTGCSKVSPGCDNCYAERIALRFGHTRLPWTADNATDNVILKPNKLTEPYSLKKPSRVFVNSMSDCFHPGVDASFLADMFEVMNDLPQHTFQILTKRPRRAARWEGPWTDNIWMGVSIENRDTLFRIDQLRECGASVKFISFEPLLEALGDIDFTGIDWAIVGGESGPDFRPMAHAWAREIRDQCVALGIPFFFKQSAAFRSEHGTKLEELDGTFSTWHQFPKPRATEPQMQLF